MIDNLVFLSKIKGNRKRNKHILCQNHLEFFYNIYKEFSGLRLCKQNHVGNPL